MRVEAQEGSFRIPTDQPTKSGGQGTAPSPFDLFLASIATCAGFYALRFCQERSIGTDGLALSMTPDWDSTLKRVARIRVQIELPASFPDKYRDALRRAVDQCTVKRHLAEPPEIDVSIGAEARTPRVAGEVTLSADSAYL